MNINAMRDIDVLTADLSTLVDIRDVIIDTSLSEPDRIRDFIRQVKNPYLYKCGKAVVKISFIETEATLEDKLESYFLSL